MKRIIRRILELLVLISSGLGLLWTLKQEVYLMYFHPITIFSVLIFFGLTIRVLWRTFRFGLKKMKPELIIISIFILVLAFYEMLNSEWYLGEPVLKAKLENSTLKLTLRGDGIFQIEEFDMIGHYKTDGYYELNGEILNLKYPDQWQYDFPQELFLDTLNKKIWLFENLTEGRVESVVGKEFFEILVLNLD